MAGGKWLRVGWWDPDDDDDDDGDDGDDVGTGQVLAQLVPCVPRHVPSPNWNRTLTDLAATGS